MINIKCPKCSQKMELIDVSHRELLFDEYRGYTDGIYWCPKCKIEVYTWTEFKIEITSHKIEQVIQCDRVD